MKSLLALFVVFSFSSAHALVSGETPKPQPIAVSLCYSLHQAMLYALIANDRARADAIWQLIESGGPDCAVAGILGARP